MADQKTDQEAVEAEGQEPAEEKTAPPGLVSRSALLEETRPDQKGSYGFKGGLIAFVDWEGKVYVTPGTKMKLELLNEAGFNQPRPQIEVPYSDGGIKSKRWLRKMLPKAEIKRSVEENQQPRMDARVHSSVIKVNLDGLDELPEDFLRERCALVEEKFYSYVGLCACFHGILSFTDWEVNTWVTPYSDNKKEMLEQHGYAYVESMIRVPYSLEDEMNKAWLARNIPSGEWERTRKEVEENRIKESFEKAKKKIEELGLKDLTDELLEGSAACEENYHEYIGMAGTHNGILSFTDPLGNTYVTPATREKVELLKSLGYQFMGSAIKVPYSLKTDRDILWLKTNIAEKFWDEAKEAARSEKEKEEQEQAEKRQRNLGLEDLPNELIDHSIKTESRQLNFAGHYFIRNKILGFVDPAGVVFITPVTRKKTEILQEAKYQQAMAGFKIPYSDGTPEDLDIIRRFLSQEELDESAREQQEEVDNELKEKIDKKIKQLGISTLPDELISRSAITELQDYGLIGHYCSRGGITCFINHDGYYYVTPTVPWKEEALKEAGYKLPEQLIKVPYGSKTEEDLHWLQNNLPAGEMEKSAKEINEVSKEKQQKELKERLEKLGIGEELPEELASRSAVTPEECPEQMGRYIIQGDILGFVGPDQQIYITPNTPGKVKILEESNYSYATKRIVLPFASNSEVDTQWRNNNLPDGEVLRSKEEIESAENEKEDSIAREVAGKRSLGSLDDEFLERCLKAEKVPAQSVGIYLKRGEMILFVDAERRLFITPSTPKKLEMLSKAGYQLQSLADIPHSSGKEEDMKWIESNLPEGELERSRSEIREGEQANVDDKVKKNMEKLHLKVVPDEVIDRSAHSGKKDPENMGRLGIYRGVLAFVMPDEGVMVTWYTPDKQEALEECGYKLGGRMPIKVPYAMKDPDQRRWLMQNLPEPDDEEQISVEENNE